MRQLYANLTILHRDTHRTLSSLRFGARAKAVKNKARVNVRLSVEELMKKLAHAERELRMLRQGGQGGQEGAGAGGEVVGMRMAESAADAGTLFAAHYCKIVRFEVTKLRLMTKCLGFSYAFRKLICPRNVIERPNLNHFTLWLMLLRGVCACIRAIGRLHCPACECT